MPDSANSVPACGDRQFEVRVEPRGAPVLVNADLPLLTSLRAVGVTLPSSCRNGTCRTCICRLSSGQVAYRIEWPGLSLEEKQAGFILPCVAYPVSDLVIDQPST